MGECILSGQGSREAVEKVIEDKISYGTEELTPNTSPLETGELYFVYE